MYYKSNIIHSINPTSLSIYRFSQLNDETKEYAFQLYGELLILDNPYIIVCDIDNVAYVCGYFQITKRDFTNSKYFDVLVRRTEHLTGEKFNLQFDKSISYSIDYWRFDESIDKKNILFELFWQIEGMYAQENEMIYIWREDVGELDFYPIYAVPDKNLLNRSFAEHFSNTFQK